MGLLLLSGSIVALLFFFKIAIFKWLLYTIEDPFFEVFLGFTGLNLLSSQIEFYLFLEKRFSALLWYSGISATAQVFLVAGPALLQLPFVYCFYGLLTVSAGKCLFLVFSGSIKPSDWKWDKEMLKRWLQLSWPVIVYSLIAGLHHAVDGWLVNYFFPGDLAVFAVYRYGIREFPLILTLTNSLHLTVIPMVGKDVTQAAGYLKERMRGLYGLSFGSVTVLLLSAPFLFLYLFSRNFLDSVLLFDIILLMNLTRLLSPQTLIMGLGLNRLMPRLSIMELLVNLIASYALLWWIGLPGVALGTLIAYTFEKVYMMEYLRRKAHIPSKEYVDWKAFWRYIPFVVIAFLLSLVLLTWCH